MCEQEREREADYLCQWPFAHNWRHSEESQRQRASWVNEHTLPSVFHTAGREGEREMGRNCMPDDLSPPVYDSVSHTHTNTHTHTHTHHRIKTQQSSSSKVDGKK